MDGGFDDPVPKCRGVVRYSADDLALMVRHLSAV